MDLPYEILVHLFKFLPRSDRKAASETCSLWYMAGNDKCFLDNKMVLFYRTILSEDTAPLQVYLNSVTPYPNYHFNEVEISSKANAFWERNGPYIKKLILRNCDVCEKIFLYIMHHCSQLEVLQIEKCKELFMSGRLLEGRTEGLLPESLKNLKVLSLSGNQYLTDALFSRFVMTAPALEEMNLSSCSLQFHLGLVKKFYPSDIDVKTNPSESVLTFFYILQFISTRAKSIKHLFFSNTLIDGSALKLLSEVEGLQLQTLELYCCDQLTNAGILSLTNHQTFIKDLNIGMCSRVTDQSLVHICNNLVNLEFLNIQRCRAVTDLGISELHKLKKLRSINVSQCELITVNGLEKGLCSTVNEVLEELDVHSLNLDQSGLITILEKLPKLISLDISYSFTAVTDSVVQVIFKNLVHLQILKMSHCDRVSDVGLTGMGKIENESSDIPFTDDYDGGNSHPRIHLGSRAEEEIVKDARRKRDVMRMCENIAIDSYSGYSLACLKNLKDLDISGCSRITDVSLTYAFSFNELVILNMSRCQQVTHEGIEHLVKNCPSIEYFNLIDCYNLKDDAVIKIAKGLRRLRELTLSGCNQLTDKSLEAVRDYCEKLQYLDVQGCRNITPEAACTIGTLPTLHTILVTKPGPYMTDGLKNRTPSTAFLPTLMRKLLSRRPHSSTNRRNE